MTRQRVLFTLIAAAAGILLTGLVVLVWSGMAPRGPDSGTTAERPLPFFALPGLEDGGRGLTSADIGGGVTVLNLFASWCVPCLAEHPFITSLSREPDVTVVGIAWMDDPAATTAWLAEHGNPYARIGVDRIGALKQALDVKGVPSAFIIDADGRIRFQRDGPLVADNAVADFRTALDAVRR